MTQYHAHTRTTTSTHTMPHTTHTDPTSYTEAAAILSKGRTSDSRKSRKIAHNTYLVLLSPREIGVRLHGTYIVRFYAEGCTVLNHGGYPTATTKERLHRYTPKNVYVYQKRYQWYVETKGLGGELSQKEEFTNGIVVDSTTGRIFSTLPRYRGTVAEVKRNTARLATPVDSSAESAIHIHTPYFPED